MELAEAESEAFMLVDKAWKMPEQSYWSKHIEVYFGGLFI